jgi:phenylalanyl-tRNA synthetase beta chain
MLHTALEVIAFNINRKNHNLKFFEFGKTYATLGTGEYKETNHLCFYLTGQLNETHWKGKPAPSDIYYIKGAAEAILSNLGVNGVSFDTTTNKELQAGLVAEWNGEKLVELGRVTPALTSKFDIKQPVFFADLYWDTLLKNGGKKVQFQEISKYPSVERDLAMVVPKSMKYKEVQEQLAKLKLKTLKEVKLFDVFESEKFGAGKKSMAVNFTFLDEEKTLTDKEIDSWMNKIMTALEKELNAEIRKQ